MGFPVLQTRGAALWVVIVTDHLRLLLHSPIASFITFPLGIYSPTSFTPTETFYSNLDCWVYMVCRIAQPQL